MIIGTLPIQFFFIDYILLNIFVQNVMNKKTTTNTSRMERNRVAYKWTHTWSHTYQQTVFFKTHTPKQPYPHSNLTFFKVFFYLLLLIILNHSVSKDTKQIYFLSFTLVKVALSEHHKLMIVWLRIDWLKGETHGLFSVKMTEFIVESFHGRSFFKWCSDTGHASEHFWNTLNYNPHLLTPGAYIGALLSFVLHFCGTPLIN